MNVLIRKTIAGEEYWDTEKKQSVFVPKGTKPDFEVTENPKSMITPEENRKVMGELFINGVEVKPDDISKINNSGGQIVAGVIKAEVLNSDGITEGEQPSELENMTVKDLRAYAKKNRIDIPAAIRAKGDIVEIIKESEK